MKKMLLLCLMVIGSAVYAGDESGAWVQFYINSGGAQTADSPFLCSKAMYTNGGLTFTWLSGIFPQDPYVYISLVYQGDPATMDIYTYVAYDKTVDGITVSVYDSTNTEIADGLVEVHLIASCQDPDEVSTVYG